MKQNPFLDLIHAKIHGLRMITNYKASKFEAEVNILIAQAYEKDCIECKNKLKAHDLKSQLKEIEPQREQERFGNLFK